MIEGFVIVKSKRMCHKHLKGKIAEVFGWWERDSGVIVYSASCNQKDYEFYEYELEPLMNGGNKMKAIVIDTETTGIRATDDILQVSIIDFDGKTLFDKYMKPIHATEWPEAERVNGISPDMVKDCETILYYKEEIQSIIDSADLIIGYNNAFDMGILADKGIKADDKAQFDVMQYFAEIYGEWNEYYQNYKWQKLTKCADYYGYEWEENAHNALGDVKATLCCYKKIIGMESN